MAQLCRSSEPPLPVTSRHRSKRENWRNATQPHTVQLWAAQHSHCSFSLPHASLAEGFLKMKSRSVEEPLKRRPVSAIHRLFQHWPPTKVQCPNSFLSVTYLPLPCPCLLCQTLHQVSYFIDFPPPSLCLPLPPSSPPLPPFFYLLNTTIYEALSGKMSSVAYATEQGLWHIPN